MADDSRKLSVTYSSGLIPPPELMSTLAVFYDEIWLPYPFISHPDTTFKMLNKIFSDCKIINDATRLRLIEINNHFKIRKSRWNLLHEEGILNTLPIDENFMRSIRWNISVFKEAERLRNRGLDYNYESTALAFHLGVEKPAPEIFSLTSREITTYGLSSQLIHYIFRYKVPRLTNIDAEQILEVRDYLQNTKEGFSYYINELTDDIERRIREHNLSDLEATQKTFERKIQPQYEEFRRKLAAKKTGFWSRVAMAGGKFMQVDATPWSIRFLGAVLEMCGVSLDEFSKAEQENFLSNKNQAFNYIATLESEVSKRSR